MEVQLFLWHFPWHKLWLFNCFESVEEAKQNYIMLTKNRKHSTIVWSSVMEWIVSTIEKPILQILGSYGTDYLISGIICLPNGYIIRIYIGEPLPASPASSSRPFSTTFIHFHVRRLKMWFEWWLQVICRHRAVFLSGLEKFRHQNCVLYLSI